MKFFSRTKWIVLPVMALLAINGLVSLFPYRWDLTQDRRFTLSEPSKMAVSALPDTVFIDVLLAGNLTSEFLRLQREIRLLLDQYTQINPNIEFAFVNPLEQPDNQGEIIEELQRLGLRPAQISIEEGGKISQELIFPWAMINMGNRSEKVQLLRSMPGESQEERINSSIENLEYAFSDAFSKLGIQVKKSVAILKGNGELEDRYLADFLKALQGYYRLAPFTLDSVDVNPEGTLKQFQNFDAAIIAKPTSAFSDAEKLVLDQYITSGGRTLWMMDAIAMDLDSLKNDTGQGIALWRDLNLDDLLFRYGIRLNAKLISDMVCAPIVLASGNGRESQYNPLPWIYYPIALSQGNHPITNNLEPVLLRFAGSIDTLKNAYRKTVLYSSSEISREEGVPSLIHLSSAGKQPDPANFTSGNIPLAVLVEGEFTSAYKNRQKAFSLNNFLETGPENKMIVIGDGDVVANQLKGGNPLELGYDQWTNAYYGNKEFLINCMNYLLEDNGLINIRNKQVKIPLLDTNRVNLERNYWQFLNVGLPALFLVIFGGLFQWVRSRKFN